MANATRKAYAGALARLQGWLAGRRLDDALLAAHLGDLFDEGLSPSSAKHVVYAVRRAAPRPTPPAGAFPSRTIPPARRRRSGSGGSAARPPGAAPARCAA